MKTNLTALSLGNFLKTTMAMVTQGLKCPPDVPAHTEMARIIPKAYPKPTCRMAVELMKNGRMTVKMLH